MDSVKVIAVELLMDASENENDFARAVGTRILGSHLLRSGKIDQGLDYLMAAKDYFEKSEDFIIASELYADVGNALYLKSEYQEAIKAFDKSIQFGKKSTDPTAEFNGEIGLGRAYIALGDTSKGVEMLLSYKDLSLLNDKYEAAADAFALLGEVEAMRGDTTLSIEYFYRSLANSKKSNSKIHLSHSYANMGILKFFSMDFDSSLYYFNASLDLRIELNNVKAIIEGYFNLGDYYNGVNQPAEGIKFFSKSRELANKNGYNNDELDAITELIVGYQMMGDSVLAETLVKEKEVLELKIKEQAGIDDEIIKSIDLDFKGKKKGKVKKEEDGIGWKTLAVIILIAALIIFFFSERKRIS